MRFGVVQFVLDRNLSFRIDLPAVVLCTAVALDLRQEWRFRHAYGGVVELFGVHHLYAIGPLVSALAQAGVPGCPRAAHHRTLLQFSGALLPVSFLVPADQAEKAAQVLSNAWPQTAPRLPRRLSLAATLGPLLLLGLVVGATVLVSFGPLHRPRSQPAVEVSEECAQRCRVLEQEGALKEGMDAAACMAQICH